MKLTALMENIAPTGLAGEHGLSVWIETDHGNYLLDTGASDRFLDNADQLGVDLSTAKAAFLSHAHFDHSGGFDGFFRRNHHAVVYARAAACQECWEIKGGNMTYIGVPRTLYQEHRDRFVFLHEDTQVEPGVWALEDRVPTAVERGRRAHMFRQTHSGMMPDDFAHEQSLVLDSSEGLVILNSCCHAGVEKIVRRVAERFPGRPVAAVVGGFHFMGAGGAGTLGVAEEEVRSTGRALVELDVKHILTGHCTGTPAYDILKQQLGDRVSYFSTGTVVEIG